MKRFSLTVFLIGLFLTGTAQIANSQKNIGTDGPLSNQWRLKSNLGLDLSSILLINPRFGSGKNQINIGGAISFFASKKNINNYWDTYTSLNFLVQRSGNGKLNNNQNIPFVKILDEWRLSSTFGYNLSENSRFYISFDGLFQSQVSPSYGVGSYLSKVEIPNQENNVFSKIFSPATIILSPSIEFKTLNGFSFLLSPVSSKTILVLDDSIASLPGNKKAMRGIHGTSWRSELDYDNIDLQLGALFKFTYTTQPFQEKSFYRSELSFYSNYLYQSEHIDFEWRNELMYEIWKGLNIVYSFNMFYDHDIPVFVTDNSFPDGIKTDLDGNPETERRISTVMQLYLLYSFTF